MTTSVSSLVSQVLQNQLTFEDKDKDKDKASVTIGNKKYTVNISDGMVTSASRNREGLWDKIKSAVCDFFGISTSKRLVKAYNTLVDKTAKNGPNERCLGGVKAVTSNHNFTNQLTGFDDGVRWDTLTVDDVRKIPEINGFLTRNSHGTDVLIKGNTITYGVNTVLDD